MKSLKQHKSQLQITLLGMDERSSKIMAMFFKGPCEGHAVVVNEDEADVAIIDTRFEHAKELLDQSLAEGKMSAIIVLTSQSFERFNHERVMYLEKPITANPMFEALDWAKDLSQGKKRHQPVIDPKVVSLKPEPAKGVKPTNDQVKMATVSSEPTPTVSQQLDDHYQSPSLGDGEPSPATTSKLQPIQDSNAEKQVSQAYTSYQISEQEFSEFIGTVIDVDLDDVAKQYYATYDPDKYYQGCVQRAYEKALQKSSILQLTLGWNPLIIFPDNQVWWEADDKLLKAVSDIEINIKTATVATIEQDELNHSSIATGKNQDLETFLWKLTLWTSRGRYPYSIDIDSPIQLKRWPNFTRHTITPHAMRIAALLIKEGPDTMPDIAKALNIELRYVSIFVSAALALNLIRQVPRPKIDEINPISRNKDKNNTPRRNILNKILHKLLGK